ncbi:MAG: arginine--tRNA ligase, partial [Bacteroidales bacterium]
MEINIKKYIKEALNSLYSVDTTNIDVAVEKTKEGINGDFTVVVFAFSKFSKKSPADTAKDLGAFIKQKYDDVSSYNVINGFLNFRMTNEYWIDRLNSLNLNNKKSEEFDKETIMVEFSSPNTNKPLHLGHIRNNILGDSVSRILKASGNHVIKTNLINDRGIHICKSMLAWMKWGNGETPETSGKKGDKLVGDYYVKFEAEYKKQIEELIKAGQTETQAKANAEIILEAHEILRKWENGDEEIRKTWRMMNSWVYKGFEQTYSDLGISFDKVYYESNTYLLGKDIVKQGLENEIFVRDEDSSVWIDLTDEG